MKMSLIFDILVWVFCLILLAWVFGGLQITLSPFTIKLTAWLRLLGVTLIIIGATCLQVYYTNSGYKEGFNDACDKIKEIVIEKEAELDKKNTTSEFKMVLYRGNTREIRETLESEYGILPLSSPKDGGYILVAGNRYSIVDEIDESIPELYDCSDSLSLFYEVCRGLNI